MLILGRWTLRVVLLWQSHPEFGRWTMDEFKRYNLIGDAIRFKMNIAASQQGWKGAVVTCLLCVCGVE
jgi:hypothetical protein